jgi:hypothetical protein
VTTAAQDDAPEEGVVADYLANRLSEDQAQAFEHYCLEHPDFARDVERELALKTGLRQAHQPIVQVSSPVHKRRYGRWPLALAASVVFLICAVAVFEYSMDRRSALVAFTSAVDLPEHLRHAAVSPVTLVRMRGKEEVTQVSAADNGLVEIRMLPDLESKSGDYSVQISTESAASIKPLTVGHLRPVDGYLQLYVPVSQMIGRTWLISVVGNGDSGQSEVYRVRIVAAPAPAG